MQDLNDMYFFAKVVEAGGFTAAARPLGMQTSLLSRRVAELERHLGVRLLHRTTRRLSLTDVGRTFHEHCLALVADAEAAREAVEQTRAEPRGQVRISCPVALMHSDVSPIIVDFLAANPLVRMHVETTGRRVDVVEEGFDVALRVRTPPLEDSQLVIRHLAETETVLLASPDLLLAHGRPERLEDLARLPTLSMTKAGDRHAWHFTDEAGQPREWRHVPRLASDDFPTLRHAALRGLGATVLPALFVSADLRAGRLERLLPQLRLPQGIVHAVFASRRGMVPAVRRFIDELGDAFSATYHGTQPDSAP